MIDEINLLEIFIETHNEYYARYKNNNGKIKKHKIQDRFCELSTFIQNSVYWARHNFDERTGKYKSGHITGKYLNELHLFYVQYGFYTILYTKVLNIYLKLTNYSTLHTLAMDSSFIRNILCTNRQRNPQYNNKPGIKIHALVDSNRVPISYISTSSVTNDSKTMMTLINNTFIDNKIVLENSKNILADTGYNTLNNIEAVTNAGFNVLFGNNGRRLNSLCETNESADITKLYKKRGISENFFSNIHRYPKLLNNYEKYLSSYDGLLIFALTMSLSKKINKIIGEMNNKELIKIREEKNEKEIIMSNHKKEKKTG